MGEGGCLSWVLPKRLPSMSVMRYTQALCRPHPQPANIPDTSYPEYSQGEIISPVISIIPPALT